MKVICIGRNYVAHAKELGNEVPTDAVIFMKPATAVTTSAEEFMIPSFTNNLHYEAELVLKICKNGKNVKPENAFEYFNEITVGIDFTARDVQNKLKEKGLPWEKAKAFDQSAMVGNWVAIDDEEKANPIQFSLHINDKIVQQGDTSLMLFSFAAIIAEASTYFTLEEGDLIFTGTPEGVGACIAGDNFVGFYKGYEVLNFKIKG
jgi:2-keto-4-pentenoate hydratase/2-oxohepta-3-ene-1,7-dioic acid hydratase in catechol pathway